MKMYRLLIRPILFLFDPEKIHHFTFSALKFFGLIPLAKNLLKTFYSFEHVKLERELFGNRFKNPVGLAAGFDKDARLIDELACFGFGFIEIGTVTPKAQDGNDKPRLFRLPEDQALINRMGFNNKGVVTAVDQLKKENRKLSSEEILEKIKLRPMTRRSTTIPIVLKHCIPTSIILW